MSRLLPWLLFAAGLAACVAFALALAWGWDYYELPAEARPAHAKHGLLRPSGRYGLPAGLVGTALFVLSLAYLCRKRLHRVRLGPLRAWMALHVFTGVTGAVLIVLHSALLPRSALGLLAGGGLVIVIGSGVIGRYIYAHVPRALSGRALERDELTRALGDQRARLRAAGFDPELLRAPEEREASRGLARQLVGLLVGDRGLRRSYARLRRAAATHADLLPLARAHCRDQHRLARYRELRALMRSWRFFHRWLALLMLILVIFHIAVAVQFGDLWVLR